MHRAITAPKKSMLAISPWQSKIAGCRRKNRLGKQNGDFVFDAGFGSGWR